MSDRLVEMYGSPDGWSGLSASGVGPAEACPARLALPACRTTGAWAERGNALHEFARVVTKNPAARAQALLDISEEYRHTAAGMDLAAALEGLDVVECEPAYALNVKERTVRRIGVNIHRDYNGQLERAGAPKMSRYEIPLSIDVEAVYAGETPVELDYKSGMYVGEPSEHGQRQICATALMIRHDAPSAISRIAYIKEDGEIVPDGHEFTMFDIDDICDRAVKTIDAIWDARAKFAAGIMPTVHPSELACKYCPAMDSCPYYLNLTRSLIGKLVEVEKGPGVTALTEEEKFEAWTLAKQAQKISEGIIERLKTMATEAPFGDSENVVAPRYQAGKASFDAGAARGLIFKLLAQSGMESNDIHAEIAKLTKKGKDFPVFQATKRKLSVVA